MKTFLSLLAAFAFVTSVQAGDNTDKAKAAPTTEQAKSACSAKTSCCAEKTACCAEKVAKKADVSIKGATLLVRR